MQVIFNRKVLALAIASTLGGFVAVDAQAVVTLDNDPTTVSGIIYATEMIVDDNNPVGDFGNAANALDLQTTLGFGVGTGSASYLRIDLSNAKFGSGATFTGTVGADTLSATNISAGGANLSYLVYAYTPQTQPGPNAVVTIAANIYKGTNKNDATATYRLYDNATAASQGSSNYLATSSGRLWAFAPSYTFASTSPGSDATTKIEVASGSMWFVGTTAPGTAIAKIGNITLTESATARLSSGVLVTATASTVDVVGTATKIKVEGDMAAFLNTLTSRVYLSTAACAPAAPTINASTVTATEAYFTVGVADFPAAGYNVCVQTAGSEAMNGGLYKATYMPTAVSTAYTAANSDTLDLQKLVKNGKTFKLLLLPGATATDDFYIRLYNSGSTTANVRATVYDATGAVVGTANSLVATAMGANTYQVLDVNQLAAAVGATSTGLVTSNARYWARVEAESINVEVMLAVRVANGTLVNMSSSVLKE